MSFSIPQSTLNSRSKTLWKEIERIGGDDVDSLLVYLFYNYRQSSSVINDLLKSLNEYHIKLLEDLSVVYNNAPLHTQTTMLQALSRNTSLSDLQDYGYDVTEGKFIYAKQTLKKNQGYIIQPQKPHLPSCKSGLNEQEWEKGNNWMLAHSTEASTSLQSAKKKQRAEPDYARFIDEDAWENEIVTENSSSNKKQSSSSSTSSQQNKNSKTISEKNTSSSNSSPSQAVDAPISLSSLFATEILDGKNAVYCDECKEKYCAERWEEMAAFPDVLALCHEYTDSACSAPSRTLLIETDRVHQRTFIKGFSEENIQHHQESNKEVILYHHIGQILHKRMNQQNGHYIAVVKRKSGNEIKWCICNDAEVTEFDCDKWSSSWNNLYTQGYTPSLSFYTKENTKPTLSTIQFGGSSFSSETSKENTSNNISSSSSSSSTSTSASTTTTTTTSSSSSSSFITPLHPTTSIPQLSSSITSSYGLEALKEKRKKTGIFSPNEKRLIFKPKTKLWKEFSEETNIKVSLSHFYKLTTNFSKAKRRTDLCGMCEKLSYLENKLKSSQNKNGLSSAEFHSLKLLRQHRLVAEMQRKHYQSTVDNLKDGEAVFVFDFKEKWKLPIRKNQLQQEFFNYQQVSQFTVISLQKINNQQIKRTFNFFSDCLSNDHRFVIECLESVIKRHFFSDTHTFKFFCDSGPHNRNRFLLHFILSKQSKLLKKKNTQLNFFAEHHGKNICDSEFGAFVNAIDNNLSTEHITSLHDLIDFFENNMNTSTSASSTSLSNIFSTSSSNSSPSSTFVNDSVHERYFEEYVPSQQISWPSLSVPHMKDYLYFERKGSFVSASAVGYLPQRSLVALESSTMKEKIQRSRKSFHSDITSSNSSLLSQSSQDLLSRRFELLLDSSSINESQNCSFGVPY
ncbi:uncharacterized protein MONOS_11334 [Monocercomonoides exilis]|uniref:uncharacterized protein n=1 Tax=Monocercomonoides exilis TaxID=2049356 RepID=UPI00355AC4B6|nr:hypothetical protein MONOS_11334 [Monocercomonoides exilis]|eukprot:MONOS_11334.1-p1 / transcript=MONOS_11334.1 / gene=MONOS_11334 / organism=Monocercomonoides_exilis_PA203 / gene_product=unspecified product / transcript_product=unspecified product / location=Mono_scaffold00563:32185-36346(-) / protein_length=906 / sequence_SO=supercontig / SO=protein_coding / is_pseudo=false